MHIHELLIDTYSALKKEDPQRWKCIVVMTVNNDRKFLKKLNEVENDPFKTLFIDSFLKGDFEKFRQSLTADDAEQIATCDEAALLLGDKCPIKVAYNCIKHKVYSTNTEVSTLKDILTMVQENYPNDLKLIKHYILDMVNNETLQALYANDKNTPRFVQEKLIKECAFTCCNYIDEDLQIECLKKLFNEKHYYTIIEAPANANLVFKAVEANNNGYANHDTIKKALEDLLKEHVISLEFVSEIVGETSGDNFLLAI